MTTDKTESDMDRLCRSMGWPAAVPSLDKRLARIELAIAEHTRGEAMNKGDWHGAGALRSAAGTILCEQRARDRETEETRAAEEVSA